MNEIEIHVKAYDDNTDKVFATVKAKAKKAGGAAGDEFSGSFSGTLSKKSVTAAEKAAKDVEAKAKEGFEKAGEEAGKSQAEGYKKGSKQTEKATEQVAKRTQAQFEALKFTALSVGLPAAATVGAVGASVALAAVPALFVGLGVAALKGNQQIDDAFEHTSDHVLTSVTRMSQGLRDPILKANDAVVASFDRLQPEIQTAMDYSSGSVEDLVGTVTDLAENAMPGLVVAAKSAQAPLKGVHDFAGQAGAGVTDFFVNLSDGSESAGKSIATTGGVVRDLEGFAGSLLAELANGSTTVLPKFAATLHTAEDTVLTLAHNGMPALQGASSGALSVIEGGLGIVNAFAQGLGAWAQPLGNVGGTLFATNSVLKLFGTSLTQTGFGVNALAKTVQDGDQKISPFKAALNDADKNGSSKLKAGLNSLVSNGLNPLGLVLTAGSFLLSAFGQAQEKAAEYAAAHKENVRQLTDALRQDSGVLGDHTNQVNSQALADKNASANLASFGQNLATAKLAIQGNSQAYDKLRFAAGATLATIADQAGVNDDQKQALIDIGHQSLETGKNYDQLKDDVLAAGKTFDSTGESAEMFSDAQQSAIEQLLNGTGAVGEQINAYKQAHQQYLDSESALTQLTAAQIENRDATAAATQEIYTQQNAQLGYRGAVLNTKQALTDYTKTSTDGKATEDQKASALLRVEQAFQAQEQAAYQAAYANSTATSDAQRTAEAFAAQNRETVNLANSMSGRLPASVQDTISKFDVATARAAGLTVGIDNTGKAVYRLPNGKTILIKADTQAARDAVNGIVRDINGRVAYITVKTINGGSSTTRFGSVGAGRGQNAVATGGRVTLGGVQRFAKGGQAYASITDVGPGGLLDGPGSGTSDSILARVSNGEYVVNARQTQKHLPLLRAINNGDDGFASGGLVRHADSSWIPPTFYSGASAGKPVTHVGAAPSPGHSGATAPSSSARPVQPLALHVTSGGGRLEEFFVEMIRRFVRVQGGDVQQVFGQG
ncbi:hypothetical protein [Amycolatopsis sp. DSM 110486]|uniref:hypothetical protein n=1 Tax=Amycolatopsis sp. DSM 110486 TaxID=2865832 RepID=UPI001C69691F|nr:hypothetical protein [Amycolatopsis sp. DSM 110486]QYN26683.1 hypothetical protein K1T34_52870 [Amycolatopsis sp. DSM 110486]